jgi:preprotein translocase subunit SecE
MEERRQFRGLGSGFMPGKGSFETSGGALHRGPRRETRGSHVARVNPGEFIRQVRAESAKIVWPTRKETVMTALMVVIMTSLLAAFFFAVDSAFSAIVHTLLGLLG